MTSVLLSAFVVLAVLYVLIVGFVARPVWSLYLYFIVWAFFPKATRLYYLTGGEYDLPAGITVASLLEATCILGILAASIRAGRSPLPLPRAALYGIGCCLIGLVVAGLLPYVGLQSAASADVHSWVVQQVEPQLRILPLLGVLYGAIVLVGCMRLIRTQKQAETILLIFFLCGIELGVEALLVFYLGMVPSIAAWSVHNSGRFQGLIFTDYDTAGMVAVVSLLCGWYFVFVKQKRAAIVGWLMIFLVLPTTFQRSVLLGFAAGTMIIWLRLPRTMPKVIVALTAVATVVLISVAGYGETVIDNSAAALGRDVRPDYLSTGSMESRMGIYLRAADLFVYLFPAGAGAGMVPYAMNDPLVVAGFGAGASERARMVYDSLVAGTRTTAVHNMAAEFVLEHGLAGLMVLVFFLLVLSRSFASWYRRRRTANSSPVAFSAETVALASLVSIGAHELVDSTRFPYSVYMALVFLVFVNARFSQMSDYRPLAGPARVQLTRPWQVPAGVAARRGVRT